MTMMINTLAILNCMKRHNYQVYENDAKPFNLNIIGIRSRSLETDVFNDHLFYLWRYGGVWSSFYVPVTCDPGLYWLKNPMKKIGTAVVKEGQYKGVWKLGKHKGKYDALVQKEPITVIRDYNKDNKIDLDSGKSETSIFGINHHRASQHGSKNVGKWSAGCIVTQHPGLYDIEIQMIKESLKYWGNSFTFTMLKEADFDPSL